MWYWIIIALIIGYMVGLYHGIDYSVRKYNRGVGK
jgi:Na+/H+-dicarboxylate symporter